MTQPPPQKKAITQFHIDKQAQALSEIYAKGGVWGKSNSTLLQGGIGSSKKYRESVDDSDNDGGDDGDVAVGFNATTTTMGREYDDENNGVGVGTFLAIQPPFLKTPFQVYNTDHPFLSIHATNTPSHTLSLLPHPVIPPSHNTHSRARYRTTSRHQITRC